jgi:hypothetical protein
MPADTHACEIRMGRRRFLQKTGLLAAGSALGCSLLSCSDYEVNIPCLGPAAPPTPVPGMTYIRASEIGCALDCDLASGRNKHHGGAATDDGPRINAAMAAASASTPSTLIIDGSALISGLFLPAGGYWGIAGLGCGTGFFVKTATNNDGIHNGPAGIIPSTPGPPAPAVRGTNVTLSNFTLNGNRAGDSTYRMRQGNDVAWFFGISLMNLDNITIENLVMVNTPSFHIRLSNVGHVSVTGCVMQGEGSNSDGLHFDGPANDITISGCSFAVGDDSIALNCPEGYCGDISRVKVTNCTFNSLSLMRLYTTIGGVQYKIDNVSVSNCSGVFTDAAFFIGLFGASDRDSVTNLAISDCNFTAPVLLGVTECFGAVTLSNVTFVPAVTSLWVDSEPNHVAALLRPPPNFPAVPFVGSSLTIRNCAIQRKTDKEVTGFLLGSNSTIDYLEFDGFAVQNIGKHASVAQLIEIDQASIGQLVLNSLQSDSIAAPVSPNGFSSIGSVSGSGVLATAWEFPDAVMADGVPYISATTGLPSIKVNGVVQPYP